MVQGLLKFIGWTTLVIIAIPGIVVATSIPDAVIAILAIVIFAFVGITSSIFFFAMAKIIEHLEALKRYMYMLNQKTTQLDDKVSTIEKAYNTYWQQR